MSRLRSALLHLALAAMLLRAMMPAGWMPSTQASGSPFVICTMHGPLTPGASKNGDRKHKADGGDMCPFAAAAQLAEAGKAPVLALPLAAPAYAERADHPVIAARIARHSPQSPRAPPALA